MITGELTSLPSTIRELAALESLELLYTKVATLPDSLAELPKFKSVMVSPVFSISQFPIDCAQILSVLTKCVTLSTLDLNNSGIPGLPASISGLKKLSRLKLNESGCLGTDSGPG
jgi:Leucine-rich repeat (LRR) protein